MTDHQVYAFILVLIPIIGIGVVYLIHLIRFGNAEESYSQGNCEVAEIRRELADVCAERDALKRALMSIAAEQTSRHHQDR